LKKSNQKTFGLGGVGNRGARARSKQKFFASFFQKRSACLVFGAAGEAWMPAFAGMTWRGFGAKAVGVVHAAQAVSRGCRHLLA
jgi:hypothetical protein